MTVYDPIPDIVHLGYTQREAAFIYLAGASSGYFLARQYARFLQRKPGALIQQFLRKAIARGDVEPLDYRQRRVVYHLKSRTIYRLLGDEESQNRRAKGDQQMKTKLMVLDYVLDHLGRQFACSPADKRSLVADFVKVPEAADLNAAADRFPLYASADAGDPSDLSFTYFDHGTATIKPFAHHLCSNRALFDVLGRFELVYVAQSPRNHIAAEHAFCRLFPATEITSALLPLGREHIVRYFEAEDRFNRNDPRLSMEDMSVLHKGDKAYVLQEHCSLRDAWHAGRAEFQKRLVALCGAKPTEGRLSFYVLSETYPIFANNYSGKQATANSGAVIGEISRSRSISNSVTPTKRTTYASDRA